jgi:hypothetical protein
MPVIDRLAQECIESIFALELRRRTAQPGVTSAVEGGRQQQQKTAPCTRFRAVGLNCPYQGDTFR